jgi:hypothetical protein
VVGDVACSCRFHHPPVRHSVPTASVGTLVPHGKAGVFTLLLYKDQKETRLQGLKDQLAAAEGTEAEEPRAEIDELESRIEELTEFESGMSFHTQSNADP